MELEYARECEIYTESEDKSVKPVEEPTDEDDELVLDDEEDEDEDEEVEVEDENSNE